MKKMILTAVMLAAAALCRAQQPAETGERREWLTSFTAVEVSAPLDVKFVQVPDTEAPKIVYDTKGSYTTKFRAEVKDKVLRITERSDARRPDRTSARLITIRWSASPLPTPWRRSTARWWPRSST